jgi:NAD(P)-dependent dehydrogenase (short-subunit alcohol dehydrogenase family)
MIGKVGGLLERPSLRFTLSLLQSVKMAVLFQNKVVLITGAGSGIGRATSIKLAGLGATLALSDINSASVVETATLCSSSSSSTPHFTAAFDIGSTAAVAEFVTAVMSKYGRIDHVFNCAGVNPTRLATQDITDAYWDKLINTNLKGLFNVTRVCIPHLQSGSSIVNVASTAALRPSAQFAVYSATKSGIIGFSKSTALELGPRGIRVNVICPGYVDTPTNASVVEGKASLDAARVRVSLGRIGTPDEIADVVAFLFSDQSRYMNGSVIEISGGVL